MNTLRRLQDYQYDNIERACNAAVREALFCGLTAVELKQIMATCWENELREKATEGAKAFLA